MRAIKKPTLLSDFDLQVDAILSDLLFGASFFDLEVTEARADNPAPEIGYSVGDARLNGRALLSARNCGVELIYRLKDTRPLLADEIAFWGRMLAKLAPPDTEIVTHAPSSGKRPDNEHLATLLAQSCAAELNRPFASMFINHAPRGNRGSWQTKLAEREANLYGYTGPGNGTNVLIVDDVVFTRSTAYRCRDAAIEAGDKCVFAVLYRA